MARLLFLLAFLLSSSNAFAAGSCVEGSPRGGFFDGMMSSVKTIVYECTADADGTVAEYTVDGITGHFTRVDTEFGTPAPDSVQTIMKTVTDVPIFTGSVLTASGPNRPDQIDQFSGGFKTSHVAVGANAQWVDVYYFME